MGSIQRIAGRLVQKMQSAIIFCASCSGLAPNCRKPPKSAEWGEIPRAERHSHQFGWSIYWGWFQFPRQKEENLQTESIPAVKLSCQARSIQRRTRETRFALLMYLPLRNPGTANGELEQSVCKDLRTLHHNVESCILCIGSITRQNILYLA